MKTASRIRSPYFLKTAVLLVLLCASGLSALPVHADAGVARIVKYSQNDIVSVRAKVRFSTLIVLPDSEDILDFTTGDKDFWIVNGVHNLCFVHPAQAGISTDLNLITGERPRLFVPADRDQQRSKHAARPEDFHRAEGPIERRRAGFLPGLRPFERSRGIQEGNSDDP